MSGSENTLAYILNYSDKSFIELTLSDKSLTELDNFLLQIMNDIFVNLDLPFREAAATLIFFKFQPRN